MQLADQKVATLEASHKELHDHQVALTKNHVDCYNVLVNEQHERLEWSRAYEYIYKEYGKLANHIQELHTTKLSLRQKLDASYETIQSYQTRIVDLEGLLEGMVAPMSSEPDNLCDNAEEQVNLPASEQLEARIDELGEEGIQMKEECEIMPFNASNGMSSAGEQGQNIDKTHQRSRSSEMGLVASPGIDGDSHSEHRQARKEGRALRRLRARKSRQLKGKNSDMKDEDN